MVEVHQEVKIKYAGVKQMVKRMNIRIKVASHFRTIKGKKIKIRRSERTINVPIRRAMEIEQGFKFPKEEKPTIPSYRKKRKLK